MSLQHALAQQLESLQRAGVRTLPRRPPLALATTNVAVAAVPVSPPAVTPSAPPRETIMPRAKAAVVPPPPAMSPTSLVGAPYPTGLPTEAAPRGALLAELAGCVANCQRCPQLAKTRTQTVFGVGTPTPRVVFFGEAPGADEDRQGEPFVGRAGQLLTKIIAACGWQRSDVYIMNVLKCRPPDNRNPEPGETAQCREYFERQFEILRPEYIVCVGTIPSQALLETTESVGKLRGRFFSYRDSRVVVTYHPSYLLRNPSAKKYVWDDMKMLLTDMGLPIPSGGG